MSADAVERDESLGQGLGRDHARAIVPGAVKFPLRTTRAARSLSLGRAAASGPAGRGDGTGSGTGRFPRGSSGGPSRCSSWCPFRPRALQHAVKQQPLLIEYRCRPSTPSEHGMRADLSAMRVHTGPAPTALPAVRAPRRSPTDHTCSSGAAPIGRTPRPGSGWLAPEAAHLVQQARGEVGGARRGGWTVSVPGVLGAGGRPLGRGELVLRLMREPGLAPCLPRPRRFNLTQAAAGRVPDLVGWNFTADAPAKSSSMTLPISPPGRPAVSRNGPSTAARWKSSVTRWTTTTETRSPTVPTHFADGISVAHGHPTSTSPTRLVEREGGRQAAIAGEYHPLNGGALGSSSGCFGQDSKGIVP